jgi:hypothetical protein
MNRKYLPLLLLTIAVAIAASSTGCGADESAEAALTKAQYGHRANLICNHASIEGAKRAGAYASEHPNGTETGMYAYAGPPTLEKALEKLEELPLPSGNEAGIEAFIDKFEQGVKKIKKNPALIAAEPNPFNAARKLAKQYELGDCGLVP